MVNSYREKNGYSLIELVISMLLVSIVLSNVYFFWKYMNNHIAHHSNYALLQKESDRIIHLITSSIRQSSEILYYSKNSIVFITGQNDDTISYSFSNDSLYKNRKPLTILMKMTTVKNFEIQALYEDPQNESHHLFLEFKLSLKNHRGDESEAKLSVKTKQPSQETDPFISW